MSLPHLITYDGLNETLLHAQWHGYISVGASTLAFWDQILTFERELDLIWRQPKSGVSILFLSNRYLAVISQPVLAYTYMSSSITYNFCKFAIAYWLIGTSILQLVLTDSIVWLCLCALYKNSKKVRWPLLSLLVVCIISATAIIGVIGVHAKGTVDIAPGVRRCTVYTPLHGLWLFWIPILIYESTTLVLVIKLYIQYLRNRKEWSSKLLELLVRDMLLYLAVILVAFIGNAVFFANPDPTVSGTLDPPTVVLLSILSNRMLLNLRAETRRAGVVYEDTRQEGSYYVDAGVVITGEVGMAGVESRMKFGRPAAQSQISTI